MIEFLAIILSPVVALIVWLIMYRFRSFEYDRAKKQHPNHFP